MCKPSKMISERVAYTTERYRFGSPNHQSQPQCNLNRPGMADDWYNCCGKPKISAVRQQTIDAEVNRKRVDGFQNITWLLDD